MNPYKGAQFLEFLSIFLKRITGIFSPNQLVEDELQIYTLIFTGSACVLVSTFLLLQKKMMIANSISHTGLLGIVLFIAALRLSSHKDFVFDPNFSFQSLLIPAFLSALITYYLTDLLIYRLRVPEDASIGIVFTFLFALSVFIVSFMGRNSHLGLEAIMGNLDALSIKDFQFSFLIFVLCLVVITIFSPSLLLLSFDLAFAKIVGLKISFMNLLLTFLCSLTLIGGFKSVGVVMILALMTFPLMTAQLFFHSIKKILLTAFLLNGITSIISVAISRAILSRYHLPLSTSGILVTLLASIFFTLLFSRNCIQKRSSSFH